MTGLFDFSMVPAENATGAPPINWQEGMPAAAVNNSAREEMAALARWHADTTGALVATGLSSGVMTLSTNQGLNLTKTFEVAFTCDGTNAGPLQASVDGTALRDVHRPGNRPLGPADLTTGVVYRMRWLPALGRYIVTSPEIGRPGLIAAFAAAGAVPGNWVLCDGRLLDRTAYAALFAVIGTTWGSTTSSNFAVPDLRGRALFGVDNMGGTPANRLTNAGGLDGDLGDTGGTETVTLTTAQMPSHTHTGTAAAGGGRVAGTTGAAGGHDHGGSTGAGGAHTPTVTAAAVPDHTHSGTATADAGHAHIYKTAASKIGTAGSGSTNTGLWNGPDVDVPTSATSPTFNVTTNPAGGFTPSITAAPVPSHTHTIPTVADHTHSIPAADDHTHALTLNSTGGGGAHPNMPPGAVVIFAIKA